MLLEKVRRRGIPKVHSTVCRFCGRSDISVVFGKEITTDIWVVFVRKSNRYHIQQLGEEGVPAII